MGRAVEGRDQGKGNGVVAELQGKACGGCKVNGARWRHEGAWVLGQSGGQGEVRTECRGAESAEVLRCTWAVLCGPEECRHGRGRRGRLRAWLLHG